MLIYLNFIKLYIYILYTKYKYKCERMKKMGVASQACLKIDICQILEQGRCLGRRDPTPAYIKPRLQKLHNNECAKRDYGRLKLS